MKNKLPPDSHPTTVAIVELFHQHGGSRYGGEAVSQVQHALQAAMFAEQAGASATLISAALLHDIGHLLHHLPEDAPTQGIDDRHEDLGSRWLEQHFGPDVYEPVNLHVAAKRYLCTVDPTYAQLLSGPSAHSLMLQGGPMNSNELMAFELHPHYLDAVKLRKWDDAAKIANLDTPPIEHFARYLNVAAQQKVLT
jgi:phosphonate degradation associated HDIG domain protein